MFSMLNSVFGMVQDSAHATRHLAKAGGYKAKAYEHQTLLEATHAYHTAKEEYKLTDEQIKAFQEL